jgi:hypothetical protein
MSLAPAVEDFGLIGVADGSRLAVKNKGKAGVRTVNERRNTRARAPPAIQIKI